MKEKRVTKRAIFASLLSVAVCTSMLIGTSYAWFTDSVTSSNNKIQAGTLKVDLQVKGGNTGYTEYTSIKDSSEPVFDYDLWEPGYTSWTNLKVINQGSLALKYTIRFVSDEDIDLTEDGLASVIDVYYADEEITADTRPEDLTMDGKLTYKGTLADCFESATAGNEGHLKADESKTSTIVLKMKEEAGNKYQGKSLAAFDLQLMAVQDTFERDSFDDQYDKDANGIPDHPEWGNLVAEKSAKVVDGEDTVVTAPGIKLTVPAGEADSDKVTLELSGAETPDGITYTSNQSATTYEINVVGADNALKKFELNIGKGLNNVKVYHSTEVFNEAENAADAVDKKFYYDSETGILTFWTVDCSPFTIVSDKLGKMVATTSEDLLAAFTFGMTDDVVLGDDLTIDASKYGWNAQGTKLMFPFVLNGQKFDGNGKTLTVTGGDGSYVFYDVCGTVKNLTIAGVSNAAAMHIEPGCSFENVTVEGTYSGAGGNDASFANYAWSAEDGEIQFKDCVSRVKIIGTGSEADYNSAFLGSIPGEGAKVRFENCVNEGTVICGVAAMLVGNDYSKNTTVIINNCKNNGLIQRTFMSDKPGRKPNMVYGNLNTGVNNVTIVDGVTYTDAQILAGAADNKLMGTGTFKVAPLDATLALTVNDDGTLTITPASSEDVAYYEVSTGLYVTVIGNGGGTTRIYATERIEGQQDAAFVAGLKNFKFVDKAWVTNHPNAEEATVEYGNVTKTYTLNGETYYYVGEREYEELSTGGNAKAASIFTVSAFDADGNLIASA